MLRLMATLLFIFSFYLASFSANAVICYDQLSTAPSDGTSDAATSSSSDTSSGHGNSNGNSNGNTNAHISLNAQGSSPQALIGCGGSNVTAPSTPTGLTSPQTDSDGNFTLSWNAALGIKPAGSYVIQQSINGQSYTSFKSVGKSITSISITGKSNGLFQYRIKACNLNFNNGQLICSGFAYSTVTNVTISTTPPAGEYLPPSKRRC